MSLLRHPDYPHGEAQAICRPATRVRQQECAELKRVKAKLRREKKAHQQTEKAFQRAEEVRQQAEEGRKLAQKGMVIHVEASVLRKV